MKISFAFKGYSDPSNHLIMRFKLTNGELSKLMLWTLSVYQALRKTTEPSVETIKKKAYSCPDAKFHNLTAFPQYKKMA